MTNQSIDKAVQDYLSKIRQSLPESLETEDLVEDLRAHIYDALEDKAARRPGADRYALLEEVLRDLGGPEDISTEFGKIAAEKPDASEARQKTVRTALRLIIRFVVVAAASWFLVTFRMAQGYEVDFWVEFFVAFAVLTVFALLEWYIRSWQSNHD